MRQVYFHFSLTEEKVRLVEKNLPKITRSKWQSQDKFSLVSRVKPLSFLNYTENTNKMPNGMSSFPGWRINEEIKK